jgi:hypothetical protein
MIVYIEAAGCPNVCRHCAAEGRRLYGAHFSLDELHTVRDEWGPLIIYHEATAHPEFPEIFDPQLSVPHGGHWPTNGFGLAQREDYAAVLERMCAIGLRTLHFTIHGLRDHHDWFVCRRGAFDDIVLAGRRARAAGFQIGWQVYLDRENIAALPELVDMSVVETGSTPWLDVPNHRVSRRLWRYEALRPRLADLRAYPAADRVFRDLHRQPPEEMTAAAWLEEWAEATDAVRLRHPFEPPTWPPTEAFDNLTLYILRNRKVYLDPMCAPRILLGDLSDGKAAIVDRLHRLAAPVYRELAPDEVTLTFEEGEELHPVCFSVRYRAISKAVFAHESRATSHSLVGLNERQQHERDS